MCNRDEVYKSKDPYAKCEKCWWAWSPWHRECRWHAFDICLKDIYDCVKSSRIEHLRCRKCEDTNWSRNLVLYRRTKGFYQKLAFGEDVKDRTKKDRESFVKWIREKERILSTRIPYEDRRRRLSDIDSVGRTPATTFHGRRHRMSSPELISR